MIDVTDTFQCVKCQMYVSVEELGEYGQDGSICKECLERRIDE